MSSRTAFQFFCLFLAAHAMPMPAQPKFVDQGVKWDEAQRKDFYSRDQGSRIMPLPWMVALKQPNGASFLADGLSRYGYLQNPMSVPEGVPVGFTVAAYEDEQWIGMTCSACHTRQIEVDGTQFRIDGGPAIVDFQKFLADLDTAVQGALASTAAFVGFAKSVLGPNAPASEKTALRKAVTAWQVPYHTLISRALPKDPWGIGRLDAVSMIFNRLAGLDIGPPPSFVIAGNISVADAPVRYPFLWNSPIQDMTQWPGFAENGNDLLGLARNIGEVYGVFAIFRPKKRFIGINYLSGNTTNFQGLEALEDMLGRLGPPKWPWNIDQTLAAKGRDIFNQDMPGGSCAACHGIQKGAFRTPFRETWMTPIMDVGTDSREYSVLGRTVDTGVLKGARILFGTPLGATDSAFNVLKTSVTNTILQRAIPFGAVASPNVSAVPSDKLSKLASDLEGAFRPKPKSAVAQFAYESRVMEGIWAAAPYLHNGSVRSLAELLKPAAQRTASFPMGPEYDIVNVGISATQPRFSTTLNTTECSQRDSGNSRCGHEFGTQLEEADKLALIEFLKTL